MIISLKHKFIYIKSHKVAGSSIEKKLKDEILEDLDYYTAIFPEESKAPIESQELYLTTIEKIRLLALYVIHFRPRRVLYWIKNNKVTSHDGILEAQILCNRHNMDIDEFRLVRSVRDKSDQNYSRYKMYKRRGITNSSYPEFIKKFGEIDESWQYLKLDKEFIDIRFSELNLDFKHVFSFLDLSDYTLDNLKK